MESNIKAAIPHVKLEDIFDLSSKTLVVDFENLNYSISHGTDFKFFLLNIILKVRKYHFLVNHIL